MYPKTPLLSEIASNEPLSRGALAYIGQRAKNSFYDKVMRKFLDSGISKSELAKRLRKDPGRINRLLSSPGNWTIETAAELLAGICREELIPETKPFLGRPEPNHRQKDALFNHNDLPQSLTITLSDGKPLEIEWLEDA